MTQEEKNEIKEIFSNHVTGIIAKQDSKFDIIDLKLDQIYQQTHKTNGRVTTLENKVVDLEKKDLVHQARCPQEKRIKEIEKNQMSNRAVKKWFITAFGVVAAIMTAVWATVKIILSLI